MTVELDDPAGRSGRADHDRHADADDQQHRAEQQRDRDDKGQHGQRHADGDVAERPRGAVEPGAELQPAHRLASTITSPDPLSAWTRNGEPSSRVSPRIATWPASLSASTR